MSSKLILIPKSELRNPSYEFQINLNSELRNPNSEFIIK